MKKIAVAAMFLMTIVLATMLSGCGKKTVSIESAAFNGESKTLSIAPGEEVELQYEVAPANATVKFDSDHKYVAEIVDGKICARSFGTCKVSLTDAAGKVFDELEVTVNVDAGYKKYVRSDNYQFAYPSNWIIYAADGTEVAYMDEATMSDLDVMSEQPANEGYFNMPAAEYRKGLENELNKAAEEENSDTSIQSSYTIESFTVHVEKYAGKKRVHIVATVTSRIDMGGMGMDMKTHLERVIMNDERSSYAMTVYVLEPIYQTDTSMVDKIINSFVVLH